MDPKGKSNSSSPSSTQPLSSLPLGSVSLDYPPFPAVTSESVNFSLEGFSPFDFDFTDTYETKPAIPAPSPVSFAPEIQPQLAAPQPLEWNPIPPFLSKTYDLVEELSLNPIISWGERGQSFVVWDPIEFARIVLPRHFKHNNFSSFVRQLNTYGFRKVDTDKWEFANECFMRGSKHLLKNIRRRRPPQSQQAISEASGSALEIELENLRKEKGLLMQEVMELQRQHHGTAEHVKTVKERLQASEQRQKQMVSFLAKVFQNPEFVEHLKQAREQRLTRKKFIKQNPHQVSGQSETSMDAHVFKPSAESTSLSSSEMLSVLPEHYHLQEFSTIPVQTQGGPSSSGGRDQPLYKGKELAIPQLEYLMDFPEELAREEALSEFPSPEPEMDFDFWSGVDDYNFPVSTGPFTSSGLSENSDVHTIRGLGSSVVDKWASDESPAGASGTSKNADDP